MHPTSASELYHTHYLSGMTNILKISSNLSMLQMKPRTPVVCHLEQTVLLKTSPPSVSRFIWHAGRNIRLFFPLGPQFPGPTHPTGEIMFQHSTYGLAKIRLRFIILFSTGYGYFSVRLQPQCPEGWAGVKCQIYIIKNKNNGNMFFFPIGISACNCVSLCCRFLTVLLKVTPFETEKLSVVRF